MTVQVVNLQTGRVMGTFADYVSAATYRRDVLIPRLADPARCPYHVINQSDADYRAASADLERHRQESTQRIAALRRRPVQGELFTDENLGAIP